MCLNKREVITSGASECVDRREYGDLYSSHVSGLSLFHTDVFRTLKAGG